MTDLARLREALDYLTVDGLILRPGVPTNPDALLAHASKLSRVLEAARAYLDLMESGGELWSEKPCTHGWTHFHYFLVHGPIETTSQGHIRQEATVPCKGGTRVRLIPDPEEAP